MVTDSDDDDLLWSVTAMLPAPIHPFLATAIELPF